MNHRDIPGSGNKSGGYDQILTVHLGGNFRGFTLCYHNVNTALSKFFFDFSRHNSGSRNRGTTGNQYSLFPLHHDITP
jgi:hypothetical protein